MNADTSTARLSLAPYCMGLIPRFSAVRNISDLKVIEDDIGRRHDAMKVRASGAYYRGRHLAEDRIATREIFQLDVVQGIQPIGYGAHKALYCDPEMGFFVCHDVQVDCDYVFEDEEDPGEEVMQVSVRFVLFAHDQSSPLSHEQQLERFHLTAQRILADICERHRTSKEGAGKRVLGVYSAVLLDYVPILVEGDHREPEYEPVYAEDSYWKEGGELLFSECPEYTGLAFEELPALSEFLEEPVRSDWQHWLEDWMIALRCMPSSHF